LIYLNIIRIWNHIFQIKFKIQWIKTIMIKVMGRLMCNHKILANKLVRVIWVKVKK
jgi:hypothetical protein